MITTFLDREIERLNTIGQLNIQGQAKLIEFKEIKEQLNLSGVSQCNELSKPKVSSKTILLINRKDGLTDLYTDDGCLGVGLNNEEVKKITGVSYCG